MSTEIDLRDLRTFLAVAAAGSISGAAETLHTTQPALSRRMRELESHLGKRLFTRDNRGITLTEEGIFLRQRAEEVLAHIARTEAEFLSRQDTVAGDVRIGAAETVAVRFVAGVMKKAGCRHPQIRWKLTSAPADTAVTYLDAGILDFAILLEPADTKRLDYIRLADIRRFGLLCRTDHPLAALPGVGPDEMPDARLLWSRQELLQKELTVWAHGRPLNIVGTFNLLFDAAFLVEEGVACALCVEDVTWLTAGRPLCWKPLRPGVESRVIVAWKKGVKFSRAAAAFRELLLLEAGVA